MPWNPFDELVQIRDRALHRPGGRSGAWTPPVDLYETSSEYVLLAELPGFSASDFTVDVTTASLTLSGRRPPLDVQTVQYLRLERGQGDFSRTFAFPEPIDASRIAADFRDGLLTVTVPKAGSTPVRRIDIG